MLSVFIMLSMFSTSQCYPTQCNSVGQAICNDKKEICNGIQLYCDPEVVIDKTTYNKTFGKGYLVVAGGYENNKTGRCYSTSDCDDTSICSACSEGSPLGVCIMTSQNCSAQPSLVPSLVPSLAPISSFILHKSSTGVFIYYPLPYIFANFFNGISGSWQTYGDVNAVVTGDGFSPISGNYIAQLVGVCRSVNKLFVTTTLPVNSTNIAVTFAFVCKNSIPYNDYANITIYNHATSIGSINISCSDVNYTKTQWTTVEFSVSSSLQLPTSATFDSSITNGGNCQKTSVLYVDGVTFNNSKLLTSAPLTGTPVFVVSKGTSCSEKGYSCETGTTCVKGICRGSK